MLRSYPPPQPEYFPFYHADAKAGEEMNCC